jgi:murein DD-endopeptidase MepM/ murein hydrolase activator NlpD
VATTALVGAGMVALATASSMPDIKIDPAALSAANLPSGTTAADASARQASADRANRAADRSSQAGTNDLVPDLWQLPLKSYTVAPSAAHTGLDLAVPEGTAYYAAHSGTVKLARWCGGLGYCVEVDAGNGTTLIYGHSAQLLVREGQQVQAGDVLGLSGNTGYSFSSHLHFEIRQNGSAIDAVGYLLAHGVDVQNHSQAIDG